MEPSEAQVRSAHITRMLMAYGREAEPVAVSAIVEGTQKIPLHVFGNAVLLAEQCKSDGFPPTIGELIDAARVDGRWHEPNSGAMRDPYWYRGSAPTPEEPHAPDGTPRQVTAGELEEVDRVRQAKRDIAAHEVHKRTGLVPSQCVRCVLDLHQEHTEPVDNCFRCQLDALFKRNSRAWTKYQPKNTPAQYAEIAGPKAWVRKLLEGYGIEPLDALSTVRRWTGDTA